MENLNDIRRFFWGEHHEPHDSPVGETCPHKGHLFMLHSLAPYPLESGNDTAFMMFFCSTCGNLVGFPNDNLLRALDQGTRYTKAFLKDAADYVRNNYFTWS